MRVYSMYQSVVEALRRQVASTPIPSSYRCRQAQLSSGTALWVPEGAFEQSNGSALKETLRSVFGMGLYSIGAGREGASSTLHCAH